MKDEDVMLIERACEITASAVRGAMGGEGSQPASFVADVFRETLAALRESIAELPTKQKAGF